MSNEKHHTHWEAESECPHCGYKQTIKIPVGEHIVLVDCPKCPHAYDYVHIVHEHKEVED